MQEANQVVVVSGLPRSGTSLMMKLLQKAGLPILTDNVRAADGDNQGGYYEYEPVKWMKEGDKSWMKNAVGKGVKIISHLLPNLPAGYSYKVVFMTRDLREIIASQDAMLKNRHEMEEKPIDEGKLAQIFAQHVEKIRDWMANQANIEVIYVDYNQLVKNPVEQLKKLETPLNLKLNAADIISEINPAYYRQRLSN
jgi:hypothetical protein